MKNIYDDASCFRTPSNRYSFFLPLDAVKVDKKYRPFKDLYEFYKFLSYSPYAKKEFFKDMLLKFSFTYRERNLPLCATTTMINRIDTALDNDTCLLCINSRDFKDWFDNYEIMNSKGEWVPFGIEIE